MKKIISDVVKHKPEIIGVMSTNNWRHFEDYFKIKEKYLLNEFDKDFEKVFCKFYILNGARGLNDAQKVEFFKLFLLKGSDLEGILRLLYKIPGYKSSHRLLLSFSSKLLHTINEELPIYDRNIAYILELPAQTAEGLLEEKIKNRLDIYQDLKNKFDLLLSNKGVRDYLKAVRQELIAKARLDKFDWQDKYISDTKLLDSSLWALYTILKK